MELKLCLMGLGNVGRELVKLLNRKCDEIKSEYDLTFNIVGIATGSHGILIDRAGIRSYLDPILISAALGVRKPSREPFDLILSQWGLRPTQVVMVGDRLDQDILGAQRAGLHQIWLRDYAEVEKSILHEHEPELTGDALTQVPALIEHLNSKG